MKNAIFCLAALALLTIAFTSCQKDATFNDQLVGNWKSVEVREGANDLTNTYTFDLRLQSSNEFDLDIVTVVPLTGSLTKSYNGDWITNDAKQDITLTYNGTGETKTWEVSTFNSQNMTAELVENETRYQVKFKRQ